MKLWFDNRFWYLVLGCLFLLGLVFIVTGFDIYNGVIIVGVVLIIAFKLFEKFIKRMVGVRKLIPTQKRCTPNYYDN